MSIFCLIPFPQASTLMQLFQHQPRTMQSRPHPWLFMATDIPKNGSISELPSKLVEGKAANDFRKTQKMRENTKFCSIPAYMEILPFVTCYTASNFCHISRTTCVRSKPELLPQLKHQPPWTSALVPCCDVYHKVLWTQRAPILEIKLICCNSLCRGHSCLPGFLNQYCC